MKPNIKSIALCMLIIILLTISAPVLANSGPVYWQGYPSSEIISIEKDSPIRVEKQNLLFDFSEWDRSFYALRGKVTAAYTMKNPTKEPQSVSMAFPFVGSLDDLLSKEILIRADGRELPYEVYFGEAVDSQGSPWQKNAKAQESAKEQENDEGKFDFASILASIRTTPYQAENFPDNAKGKLYTVEVEPASNQRINLAMDLEYDPAKTKVLTKGFNSYSYDTGSRKRTIGTWCDQLRTLELYVLGEDIQFELKGFTNGKIEERDDLFSYKIKVSEPELKSYLMEYVNRNIHVQSGNPIFTNQSYSDQLFNLYAQALDQAFTRNAGYSTEDDLMALGNARRMITLVYTVEFPPESTQEVSVSYQATGTMDRTKTVNPLYRFDYLFNPAENWNEFHNLKIKIITPRVAPYVVESSLELAREEERVYTASLAELPEKDFSFTLYEGEKVTLLDKTQGNLNSVFGYFAPLVTGLAVFLGIVGLSIGVRRFKKRGIPGR